MCKYLQFHLGAPSAASVFDNVDFHQPLCKGGNGGRTWKSLVEKERSVSPCIRIRREALRSPEGTT
jgi:hypothetical protein